MPLWMNYLLSLPSPRPECSLGYNILSTINNEWAVTSGPGNNETETWASDTAPWPLLQPPTPRWHTGYTWESESWEMCSNAIEKENTFWRLKGERWTTFLFWDENWEPWWIHKIGEGFQLHNKISCESYPWHDTFHDQFQVITSPQPNTISHLKYFPFLVKNRV